MVSGRALWSTGGVGDPTHGVAAAVPAGPWGGWGSGQQFFPFCPSGRKSKIGIEQMSARSQRPRDFGEETRKIRIAMGRFDVDDDVEGAGGERQVFGIALDEIQSIDAMPLFAKLDAGGIQIQGGVAFGLE